MKRFTYFVLCAFTCAVLMTACGKGNDNIDTEENTSAATVKKETKENNKGSDQTEAPAEEDLNEVPVNDALPAEDETEEAATDSSLTESQENVAKNPEEEFHGSGTFNGFVDSSSVEVTMSDGTYQTFFVYDDTVYNKLVSLSENESEVNIQFTYKAREGQVNPEIIAIN